MSAGIGFLLVSFPAVLVFSGLLELPVSAAVWLPTGSTKNPLICLWALGDRLSQGSRGSEVVLAGNG
jgi:hypothetical protein